MLKEQEEIPALRLYIAKGLVMAFEDIKAELALLFEQMVNQPEDAHEIRETLHEKLNALKASGLPLPEDLVELEKRLTRDFEA